MSKPSFCSLLLLLALLCGCRSGAFDRERVVLGGDVVRAAENPDDLLLARIDLGYDHTHVLEVVGHRDLQRVQLRPTPTSPGLEARGAAESYLVYATFRGSDALAVATVHVLEPTGLLIETENGGGSCQALALAPGLADRWVGGVAQGDMQQALRGLRTLDGPTLREPGR